MPSEIACLFLLLFRAIIPITTVAQNITSGLCAEDGADCRASRCCSNSSKRCFEKNETTATCLHTCALGIHADDPPEYQAPWSCIVVAPPLVGVFSFDKPAVINNITGVTHTAFQWYAAFPEILHGGLKASATQFLNDTKTLGAVAMLHIEYFHGLDSHNESELVEFGEYLHSFDMPIIISWNHGMNGIQYIWGQQPTLYKQKFREFAETVQGIAPQVVMAWTPSQEYGYPWGTPTLNADDFTAMDTNSDGIIDAADDPFLPFYPGDDVVQWVGLTLFWFAFDSTTALIGYNSIPEPTFWSDAIDHFHELASNLRKPMMIAGTSAIYDVADTRGGGASEFDIKASWIRQVYDVSDFPQIMLIFWFSAVMYEKDVNSTVDWSIESPAISQFYYEFVSHCCISSPIEGSAFLNISQPKETPQLSQISTSSSSSSGMTPQLSQISTSPSSSRGAQVSQISTSPSSNSGSASTTTVHKDPNGTVFLTNGTIVGSEEQGTETLVFIILAISVPIFLVSAGLGYRYQRRCRRLDSTKTSFVAEDSTQVSFTVEEQVVGEDDVKNSAEIMEVNPSIVEDAWQQCDSAEIMDPLDIVEESLQQCGIAIDEFIETLCRNQPDRVKLKI